MPTRPEELAGIATRLGTWFDEHARDLPWRHRRDPYLVWVSEVMLQQTRVQTVLAYYPRFVKAYPTVRELARAPLPDVLGAWSGLGYYRRARALHDGARAVVREFGSVLPQDVEKLRRIPGIGRYTAGAIASLAFGRAEPVVDGNVARVLARLFALRVDVRSAVGQRTLWQLATDLLPSERPGRHNEALMELGALVCRVGVPDCGICPLSSDCQANRLGVQSTLPVVGRPKTASAVAMVALIAHRGGSVLLGRRTEHGLFGGLWEPPMVQVVGSGSGEDEREDSRKVLARWLGGVDARRMTLLGTVFHTLTHRKLTITVVGVTLPDREIAVQAPYERLAWYPRNEIEGLALSTLARKILAISAIPGPPNKPGVRRKRRA